VRYLIEYAIYVFEITGSVDLLKRWEGQWERYKDVVRMGAALFSIPKS
jgi:hypothetical protein